MYQVVALTILLHLAFAGSRVTLSLFALHLGASTMTVGLLISLLAALPLLFSVGWGRAIDRIGVRKPMLAGACVVLAAVLLAAAVPNLAMLFVVSTAVGSGFMAVHICVSQMAGLLGAPHERTRNFSLLALAFSTSGFLGPMLAGFAIDAFGHRITFLLLGLSAAAAIAWLWLRPLPEPPAAPRASGGERRRIADLLRIPELRRAFIASTVLSMAWDLFTFVTPIHGTRLGLSASVIGLILGCFGGAIFLVRLVLPVVVHRLREWPMLIGAMIATGVAMAVFPLLSSVPLLMLTAFLIGLAIGGTQPMIMAVLYNAAPEGRGGEVVGVRTFLLNLTQAGMPLLFGIAGSALGMAPVFWVMAAVLFAGSACGTGRRAPK
ncbi:MAG: MFS transporter [Betaproteobacteria bacterium]|jgi:predicted MFS family arabinose efflux permease|nr:MFS transporter [Betaproteobacteria bacterium]